MGLLSLFFLFNCTSIIKVQTKVQSQYRAESYDKAVKTMEKAKKKYRSRNSLLYYLDYGLALHHAGKYKESNAAFEKAKIISQQHYTKSISAQTASFLINDKILPYYGEDFEQISVRLFSALNHLKLNSVESALVEMRQADALLSKFETDYGEKTTYTEDAFLRYFSGILYEEFGDFNNAQVAYYRALKAYEKYSSVYQVETPPELISDLYRVSEKLGFQERMNEMRDKYNHIPSDTSVESELVFLHFNGFTPHKNEFFFEISLFGALPYLEAEEVSSQDELQVNQAKAMVRSIGGKQLIRIAFPKMKDSAYKIKQSTLSKDQLSDSSRVVYNIGNIAKQSMEDKNARIKGKTIARAVVKYVTAHAASAVVGAKEGATLGFLTQVIMQAAATATERADVRSWRTLPNEVRMIRLPIASGDHTLKITFLDASGNQVRSKNLAISVKPSQRKIILVHSFL